MTVSISAPALMGTRHLSRPEKVRTLAKALAARYKGGAIAFALEQADQSDGGNRSTWLNVVDALNIDLAIHHRIEELRSDPPARVRVPPEG